MLHLAMLHIDFAHFDWVAVASALGHMVRMLSGAASGG